MTEPGPAPETRKPRPLAVLSIQSRVVYGHVGNSAAMPALAALGIETWPIDTVSYSSHLGYPQARGMRHGPDALTPLLDGLEAIGALADCDAVLSGYIGDEGNAGLIADAVARVKRHNPAAFYLLDPVMGERSDGLYVAEAVAAAIRDALLPIADIVLPNQFELGWLTGMNSDMIEGSIDAADALRRGTARDLAVVVTGIEADDATLATVAIDASGAWRIDVERRKLMAHGTGDYFAASLTGHLLLGAALPAALAGATAETQAVVAATVAAARHELLLGDAMDSFKPSSGTKRADRMPARSFEAVRLR